MRHFLEKCFIKIIEVSRLVMTPIKVTTKISVLTKSILMFNKMIYGELFVGNIYWFKAKNSSPTIIDASANQGYATLYFKSIYPKANITSIEPNEYNFKKLKKNTRHLKEVEYVQAGLGAKREQVVFSGTGVHFSKYREKAKEEQIVNIIPLSDILKKKNQQIDLLKLDIEGCEHEVLDDLCKTKTIKYISRMIIEYHHNINPKLSLASFLNNLEKSGFKYQIDAFCPLIGSEGKPQDVFIHAYR